MAVAPSSSKPAQPGVSQPQAAAQAVGYATAQVVRRDVRRVLVLAAFYIVVLILLWLLFTHTGLGRAVYNSVKF